MQTLERLPVLLTLLEESIFGNNKFEFWQLYCKVREHQLNEIFHWNLVVVCQSPVWEKKAMKLKAAMLTSTTRESIHFLVTLNSELLQWLNTDIAWIYIQ